MKICEDMSRDELAKRMVGTPTMEQVEDMRARLVEEFDGMDTFDVPDDIWLFT